jgi:formate hydrogenlyase transcriptional activator
LQPKLLRVVQEQEFERLGGTRTQHVDVRLVAATNRDLEQMVESKQFREDLYFRLNVFPIRLSPLRERPEDIPLLVRHFVDKYARRMSKGIEIIPNEAMQWLQRYTWPGNIRELQNFIERSVILSSDNQLRPPLSELRNKVEHYAATGETLDKAEAEHILKVLEQTQWVIGGPRGAALRLGLKRTTLLSKMQRLGISRSTA